MSGKVVVRSLGVLIALSLVVGLCAITYVAGCTSDDLGSDFGIVEPGCRTPSQCFTNAGVGPNTCACHRSDVLGSPGVPASCRSACDTGTGVTCLCNNNADAGAVTVCHEPAEVCVGAATTTCEGTGARCVAFGSTCATATTSSPPQLVGTGTNGTIEPRCQYIDDVCCPGTIVNTVDAAVDPLDAGVTDM